MKRIQRVFLAGIAGGAISEKFPLPAMLAGWNAGVFSC
jgi:hypothetical protein